MDFYLNLLLNIKYHKDGLGMHLMRTFEKLIILKADIASCVLTKNNNLRDITWKSGLPLYRKRMNKQWRTLVHKPYWSGFNSAKSKTFPVSDTTYDDDFVLMNIKIQMKKLKNHKHQTKFNLSELKDPAISVSFHGTTIGSVIVKRHNSHP